VNKDLMMEAQTTEQLVAKKCLPCEGGVAPYSPQEAADQLTKLSGWYLTHDGQRIRKDWTVKNFMAAIDFFVRIAAVAEEDQHRQACLDL
jgi:4a-hydroxytetrahydrobiopterin dehydratase